jgi:CubicO group peptidase (beta-lactamase class C family)
MRAVPLLRLVPVVLALLPGAARGQEPAPGLSAQVRARMQAFVDQGEIAGAVTVFGRAGGVLSHEAVGSQSLETRTPMPKDALFRIASMTKPVTAMGVMILAEEGKLSVTDPVEQHLPEFRGQLIVADGSMRDALSGTGSVTLKKPPRAITIRDLLTHTSGLPGQFPPGLSDIYVKRNRTLADGVLAISQRPLEFTPGSRWAYCNPGIDTLGRVIEVCSGQSYEDFLRARIFGPLGMDDTTFYPTPPQRDRLAMTYDRKGNGPLTPNPSSLIALPPPGSKYPVPAGGLFSTGADLTKLYRMMLGRGALNGTRVLKPESVAEMTRVQTGELKTGFVDGMGFGYGWGVVRQPQGVTEALSAGSYGHGGAFGTQGWLDPHRDLFVVLLIQRTGLPNGDASPMRKELQAVAAAAVR